MLRNDHLRGCRAAKRLRTGWGTARLERAQNRFVGEIARTYDQPGIGMFDAHVLDTTVDCLFELTDGGAALEFAIGTGRVLSLWPPGACR